MSQYSTINFKEIIHSDYLNEDILDLMNYTFEIPESYTYNIFEVTKEYIARPDLISLDAYGDGMFTDIICKLNGVSNPFELNEGMKLIIPSPEDIMKFAIQPSLKDLDANWGGVLSGKQTNITAKNTKSKRSPGRVR